ncbi:MAG: tripartite tricarboxylate transporter substrate binding protein [Betaproteobacteria bacterium]|nr:tripartite tricarboxylate transporter substrate binding protein [Betaproteobacteria bacterium]
MKLKDFGALILLPVLSLGLCAAPGVAQERQAYPSRPVRFIIPFPPSGGTDIVGRMIAQKFAEQLGQPFVIDNRPGAAGTLGASIAAKAAADGYTMVMVTASFSISASFYRNLPYDPVKDFDAVGLVASQPAVLVTHPSVPASSVKELIALARANPGKLNYASGGAGGINHLAAEMLKSMTGIRIVHIPYKGLGPALTALLAGEVQLMIATLGSSLPHIRSGKLRALALAGAKRSSSAPDLATLAESGVAGYEVDNWYGVLVPRGTPRGIIGVLNKRIVAIVGSEDVRERFAALGFETAASTPVRFADYLKSEIAKWARAMKDAGVTPG